MNWQLHSLPAISAAPEAKGLAARAVRARHLCSDTTIVLPGEFTSGPQAEGPGGAAGAAGGSKEWLLLTTPWSGVPGADAPGSVIGNRIRLEASRADCREYQQDRVVLSGCLRAVRVQK